MGWLDHSSYKVKKKTSDHSLTPKFSSIVPIYELAVHAVFSNFKQFYLHILWNEEENIPVKMSAAQYTLNQGWKCSKYATAKPKSSECHIHKVTPLSKPTAWSKAFPVTHFSFIPSFPNQEEEIRGSEKQRDYIWARNHLKEFNSLWPMVISYWSNQRQTHIPVFPSMPVT